MYAKIFTSIYQGTLRGDTHGLVVFTNLLAHADAEGWVDIHPKAIAEEVGLTVEQVRKAISALEAPDPESRSPEEEGRRIVRLDEHRDWGWRIVNHAKYRSIRNEEERREQNRLAQQRWREKNKPPVSTSKHDKPIQKQKHIHKQEDQKTAPKGDLLVGIEPEIAADFKALRTKLRAPITATAMKGIQREADKAGVSLQDALRICCENSWRGFKAEWFENLSRKSNGTHQPRESASGRAERLGNEHLARIEEAERRGNDPLLAAHGRDIRS